MNPAKEKDVRTIRATDCNWFENGDTPGELVERTVRILYFSPTIKELKQAREDVARHFKDSPDDPYYVSQVLMVRLHSLPDFKVGVGQPNPITIDWLDAQDLKNLDAIQEAIKDDLNPKSQPGT